MTGKVRSEYEDIGCKDQGVGAEARSLLEELVLKKALSEAHAESQRLIAAAEDLHRKYQAATSGENLLKLVVVDHKRTINFFTIEMEKMKLSQRDEVDRLRLELSQAKDWARWFHRQRYESPTIPQS